MRLPKIDPDAYYTEDQCAQMLAEFEGLSLEDAKKEIRRAIKAGDLKVAGFLQPVRSR